MMIMGMVPEPRHDGVIVGFYKRDTGDYITVQHAGDAGQEYHGKVTPQDIQRFPEQWDAYVKGLDMPPVVGTPLTEIPGFTQELERFYRAHGISVCEQFAEASDAVCQKLGMGVMGFRKMAKLIVENKKSKGDTAQIDALVAAKVEQALAERAAAEAAIEARAPARKGKAA
jgi:hypothetical protein